MPVGHSYNGPGGGIAVDKHGQPMGDSATGSKPIRPAAQPVAGTPLTNSIQANFQGFSFAGESLLVSLRLGRRSQQSGWDAC